MKIFVKYIDLLNESGGMCSVPIKVVEKREAPSVVCVCGWVGK